MIYVRSASGIGGVAGVGLALPHHAPDGASGCGDARGAALPCVRRSGVMRDDAGLGNVEAWGLGDG
jgi:hypothetical protein